MEARTDTETTAGHMLRQWLEHAAKRMVEEGAAAVEPDGDDHLNTVLSSMPPVAHPVEAALIPRFIVDEIKHFQVLRLDQVLKTEFGLRLGLADNRVMVLGIGIDDQHDYAGAALKTIAENLADRDFAEGLPLAVEAASRIWVLGTSQSRDLAPGDVRREDIESVYRKIRERKRAAPDAGSRVLPSPLNGDHPILAILGLCLPALDSADLALFHNELRLAMYTEQPAVGGNNEDRLFKLWRRGPMPPDEYWKAYAEYLKKRPQSPHAEPADPGHYGEFLESRQKMRDSRLRLLRPYTGVRRARAGEDDILAGPQARVFRFIELLLREAGTGAAVLATDTAFLAHPGTVGIRKSLIASCNHIFVDELASIAYNASSTPDFGSAQEEGGLSVVTLCPASETLPAKKNICTASYRRHDDRETMLASHKTGESHRYTRLFPDENNDYSLFPLKTSREYLSWLFLPDISAEPPLSGLMEKRGGALVDIDRSRLEVRMREYFDKAVSWSEYARPENSLAVLLARYQPKATREAALESGGFDPDAIKSYSVKPFDNRWCYYSTVKSLWSDCKPRFAALRGGGNRFVATRADKAVPDEGVPFFFTTLLGDGDLLRGHSYYFPVLRLDDEGKHTANLSNRMLDYLTALGILPDIPAIEAAGMVWNHVLAVAFSSAYLNGNAEGIGQGWPRIPFPAMPGGGAGAREQAKAAFMESARLGQAVAVLLDSESGVDGVTRGAVRPELRSMAVLWDTGNNVPLPDGEGCDIPVNAGWGKLFEDRSVDKSGKNKKAVLPSRGRLESRDFTPEEKLALETGAFAAGVHVGGAYACLGGETFDIHLNDDVLVRNIPSRVWNFTIGGYPVLKKWLSYRETAILGRPLAIGEVRIFTEMVRRIAALLLLTPRLNRNYAVIRDLHPALS